MPAFLWFLFGGLVGGAAGSVLGASAGMSAGMMPMLPVAYDPQLADAYARSLHLDAKGRADLDKMLAGLRAYAAAKFGIRAPHGLPPLPPPPDAAAGALWTHHGYYDPLWPGRVYGGYEDYYPNGYGY